jgi:23S rRNA (guanosine2251-2'-O)-methyltransferase
MKEDKIIYGIHSVAEALKGNQDLEKIYINKSVQSSALEEIVQLAKQQGVKVSFVPAVKFMKYAHLNHQDVIAHLSLVVYASFEETVEKVLQENEQPIFLLLDGVTDVRTLGAIVRTASCTGVDAIILPMNNSAPINEDAIKTSSGAVFQVPICRVNHMNDAVYYLQSSGVSILAATEKTDQLIYTHTLPQKLAVIMGDEGRGVNPSTLKLADLKLKLPLSGSIGSLNVSVACGAFLYEIVRQRMS